jgi:hypothetical protein
MTDESDGKAALPVPYWLRPEPLSLLGGFLPVMPGWIFFVLAIYLLATEFRSGRRWVTWARRRWPWMSEWITRARNHRWAPRHLEEFDDLTDPRRH